MADGTSTTTEEASPTPPTTATAEPAAAHRTRRWRDALVRPAGGGDRRRPAAVIQLVVGSLGAAAIYALITLAPASDQGLTSWFVDIGLNQSWVGTTARVLLLGVIPGAVLVIALVTQSWRLMISTAAAIVTTLAITLVLNPLTEPTGDRRQQIEALAILSHFPLLGVAVPIAILTVASSFLARPSRRLLAWAAVIGLLAFVIAVDALLLDVLASALIGWAAAGLAGLVFESPVGDPMPEEIALDLAQLGVHASSVTASDHPMWGTARYRAEIDGSGAVLVDVHGREAEDARAMQRTWRAMVDKHGSSRVAVGRREQAQHEALCLTLAERANVPVPHLVATGAVGSAENGVVVVDDDDARPFRELDDDAVDDELLGSIWRAVTAAHNAGFAHNLLDGAAIEVRADNSAQLTDWFNAQTVADDQSKAVDVATVMLVTAAKTDATRAVAAAMDSVGKEGVTSALPLCQLGILDRVARHDVDKHVASAVQSAAAEAIGVEKPELAELRRVSATDLLMLGGTLLGFWLLYNQLASLGDLWSTLGDASWPWVAWVFVLAQVSVVFTAVALRGSVVQPLALGRLIALEYADLFTGLVGGTVAITATNIRYFQKEGLAATTAVTSGVVSSAAGGLVQLIVILIGLPYLISTDKLHLGDTGGSSDSGAAGGGRILIIALILIALISGAALLVPRFRKTVVAKVKPKFEQAKHEIVDLFHRPKNLMTMLGGQLAMQLVLALALGAALRAFGVSLSLFDLLLINTFANLIGGIAPSPGGMGAIEAGLIAGFTAFGVDTTVAGAATFTYRLFTGYLPPAWGYPTMAWMRRRGLL